MIDFKSRRTIVVKHDLALVTAQAVLDLDEAHLDPRTEFDQPDGALLAHRRPAIRPADVPAGELDALA